MKVKIKKIFLFVVLTAIIAISFAWAKPAQAIFGIADISVTTIAIDIPQTIFNIGKTITTQFLEQLRKRLVTMLQNDIVNFVQNGGKPRFITDPKKFLSDAADTAAVQALDNFFSSKKVDICSPFRANLEILVQKAYFLPETKARCTLGSIADNLVQFKDNFIKGGGWQTWIALHETGNNLPGAYLAATEVIGADISRSQNSATAQITAGGGFLDQKICVKSKRYSATETRGKDSEEYENLLDRGYSLEEAESLSLRVSRSSTEASGFEYTDYSSRPGGGIKTSELPPGEICVEDKTVTPGAIVKDQLSGVLKGTGIDKLIQADELAQLVNAVIDATVNRAFNEGLSLMKTGRGSYTTPQGKSYSDRSRNQTEIPGLEGASGADLLNKIIGLKTNVDKLERTYNKLIMDNKKSAYLLGELDKVFANPDSLTCGVRTEAVTGEGIDKCFFSKLNEEDNNPGPYLANKILNQKLEEKWTQTATTLKNLASSASGQCRDMRYITNPDQDDLPIITGGGTGFVWENTKFSFLNYINSDEADKVPAADWKASYLELDALPRIEIQKQQYKPIVEQYDQLIKNTEELKNGVKSETDFVKLIQPGLTLYASLLLDYDKAGRETDPSLVIAVKKYNDALNSGNKTSLDIAKKELERTQEAARTNWRAIQQNIITTDTNEALQASPTRTYNADDVIKAKTKLRIIDRAISLITRSIVPLPEIVNVIIKGELVPTAIDQLAIGDIVLVARGGIIPTDGTIEEGEGTVDESRVFASGGTRQVRPGAQVIAGSLNIGGELEIRVISVIINPAESTLSVSEAVGQAMVELKEIPFSITEIKSELDSREAKINKQQSEASSVLGKFLSTLDERVTAANDPGDSEWEKYFYNRRQFAYVSMINNYYAKHFKCQ